MAGEIELLKTEVMEAVAVMQAAAAKIAGTTDPAELAALAAQLDTAANALRDAMGPVVPPPPPPTP